MQKRAGGGQLVQEVGPPYKPSGMDIREWTKLKIDQAVSSGNKIRFDVTSMDNIQDVLAGKGPYANSVTSVELRYFKENWAKFKDSVIFYSHDEVIPPPPGFEK